MKYLFILGRNIELSVAEVFAFLKRFGIEVLGSEKKDNGLLVDIGKELPLDTVDKLGGTISIGEVLGGDLGQLDEKVLYSGSENKFNYVIWGFGNGGDFRSYLKSRFKEEKFKASEKRLRGLLKTQGGEEIPIIGSKNISEQFFIFGENYGRIIQISDYESLEKRDMEKPARRGMLAISPRLGKIMINFSLVKEGGILLDSFCGIGSILQEALLQKLKVVGIDVVESAIDGAQKNLEWGKFSKEDYKLINGDSRNVEIDGVDVLVAEPDLGETLKSVGRIVVRKTYSFERANNRMKKFESLMIEVLNHLKNKVSGRIVFTSPFIKSFDRRNKRVGCDIGVILRKTGLRLVDGFPIDDFRPDQVTGRQIFVLKH
jgi:tRNA G10  N-methylase Trm11